MSLSVEIQTAGPCKKHVRVQVPRIDLDHFYNEAVKDLVTTAAVPGFRTGHVPRKLVEKRFRKEVGDHVRQKVLMQSLQQLGEDHKLDAINEPDLDVETLVLPEEGDFNYEFDVEVRPEFDLPELLGAEGQAAGPDDHRRRRSEYLEKYLSQFGQLVPHDGPAEARRLRAGRHARSNATGTELGRASGTADPHSAARCDSPTPRLRISTS